ncbi:MAG: aldehyde dehydrogenase family protein [Alphaproteobacteria bacterium]|nr:aldehyde dehydrogenase family protein [Alphaproteobacteria bacterium]
MTTHNHEFYINGEWVKPVSPRTWDLINPANEEKWNEISLGSSADVDKAVAAARAAFVPWSQTPVEKRLAIMGKIAEIYQRRIGEVAETISKEMGAPIWLAKAAQAPIGLAHMVEAIGYLKDFEWEKQQGKTRIAYEPIGVVGMITPWNWPINQIFCKVAPALAAGCTMVLKPSEYTPINALIVAEIMHEAGVPKGVFNLVNGDGPGVGAPLSGHPGVDMMSFTGSTRAGILVAKAAADTVKRVAQELGGKGPNIILDDADLAKAVGGSVQTMMMNSGQSCNAPSRMFVPEKLHDQAVAIAADLANKTKVGDPFADGTNIGPVVNKTQFERIQGLIKKGIDEGATVAAGGLGRPEGLNRGYYVRPTIFANATNDMTIAREEIFGPVMTVIPYKTEADAIAMANDTPYGLSGYVQGTNLERARKVAKQIRAGDVRINHPGMDTKAPFGGYKQSGNGREWGEFGFHEFLEVKAMLGYEAA